MSKGLAFLCAAGCLGAGILGWAQMSGGDTKLPTGQVAGAPTGSYAAPEEMAPATSRLNPEQPERQVAQAQETKIPSSEISLSREQQQAAQEMNIAPLGDQAGRQQESQDRGEATPMSGARPSENQECKWKKTMLSTAYGPPWNAVEGGPITATGKALVPNRYYIATDPSVIPTGSKVKVWPNPHNYRGVFRAEDTGGAIKGDKIDIFVWQGKSVRDVWKKNVQVCLLK